MWLQIYDAKFFAVDQAVFCANVIMISSSGSGRSSDAMNQVTFGYFIFNLVPLSWKLWFDNFQFSTLTQNWSSLYELNIQHLKALFSYFCHRKLKITHKLCSISLLPTKSDNGCGSNRKFPLKPHNWCNANVRQSLDIWACLIFNFCLQIENWKLKIRQATVHAGISAIQTIHWLCQQVIIR